MRTSRRLLLVAVLAALVGMLAASTAIGADQVIDSPDSPRFFFFGGVPEEYPAGAAFHVWHGWAIEPGKFGVPPSDYDFHLFVDGYQQVPEIGCIDGEAADSPCRAFLYDFPDGLPPGTHELVGVWIAPCGAFVGSFNPWNSCVDQAEPMAHPNLIKTFEVTFTAP